MLLKKSGLCFFFFTLLARFFLFAFKERIILRNRRHSLRPRSLNIKEEIIEEFLDERKKISHLLGILLALQENPYK